MGRIFGYLTRLVDELGVGLLEALETRDTMGEKVSPSFMMVFRALRTAGYRKHILDLLKNQKLKLQDIRRKGEDLAHQQWVDFNWETDDPACPIHPTISMHPPWPGMLWDCGLWVSGARGHTVAGMCWGIHGSLF